MIRSQILLVATLSGCTFGCIGAPFSLPPPTVDAGELQSDDAGTEAATSDRAVGAEAPDASDAGTLDAADGAEVPDANRDAASCSPVTATPHDVCPLEPSAPNPFPGCYDRMAAAPPAGCPSINACETTPAACQCAETFNCACLKANGVNWKNCKDVGGAPWVY